MWDEDTGEPFGKAGPRQSLRWPSARCTYRGKLSDQFYLERLDDGSNFAAHADALSGDWESYGTTEEERFAAIDEQFGAGTEQAALWRCILRNGIPLSNVSSSPGVGEFDFTMGSGWLYSLNGSYYPGSAMSAYKLKNGDQLTLRYTLAYGCDVGAPQGGYGNTVGYCVRVVTGEWTLEHQYEETTLDDGTALRSRSWMQAIPTPRSSTAPCAAAAAMRQSCRTTGSAAPIPPPVWSRVRCT